MNGTNRSSSNKKGLIVKMKAKKRPKKRKRAAAAGEDHRFLWNSLNLSVPKPEFHESTKKTYRRVREAVKCECSANKYRDSLFLESVTLSRFMDDRKRKYRGDKGFRIAGKINKVVERIHLVDLKSATSFVKSNLTETFVPSKQLAQWMLIKLQSNALLLRCLVEYCTYAASKLHHRLKTGHNWIEVTMALSMISRIWTVSKYLLNNSVQSYGKLVLTLDSLKDSEAEKHWLNSQYEFPENLQDWIDQR